MSSRRCSRSRDGSTTATLTKGSGASLESRMDSTLLEALKHIDTFYQAPPPGLVKDRNQERPEDCIPDRPENKDAREFLAKAPSKGLWMPLGKEVKVMQCWKCKNYGHRSGDKECPLYESGNRKIEQFRYMHEDPMYGFVQEHKAAQKEERIKMLQSLLEDSDEEKKAAKKKKKEKADKKEKAEHGDKVKQKRHNKERRLEKDSRRERKEERRMESHGNPRKSSKDHRRKKSRSRSRDRSSRR
ncbi:hypothetical protein RvY_03639 [Ramazzottius varieornatus]|uniref:Uncharacterized protein n=1 Tax=Ramazzottius varieornatus TaxID=947166 RepID=A0A1D1UNT4_RAMVA|nr:hypothetical protein RvY_03639 [Ramazzottius varieornatus]